MGEVLLNATGHVPSLRDHSLVHATGAVTSNAPQQVHRSCARAGGSERSHRAYAELVGGPLDGLLLDITGWTTDEIQAVVALMTEPGQFGPGGRSLYDPRPGERNR